MSKEHEDLDRARQAQELLDHPLLTQALDAIEREVVEVWADAKALSKDEKEALWQHMRACRNIRSMLLAYINTGKVAADRLKTLQEKETLMQRMRRVA